MSKIESVVYGTMVVDVQTRAVSNGTKTIWEIITQDGTKWATFNTALGNKSLALKGQLADLKIAIEQKDSFTNYYLNDIQPAKNQPQGATTPVQAAIEQAQAAQIQAPAVSYDQYKDLEQGKEDRRNASIHRQTASKVAAELDPMNPQEFWGNVAMLVEFYATGTIPTAYAPNEGSVTSHTDPPPLPWVETPPPHTDADFQGADDDIPF